MQRWGYLDPGVGCEQTYLGICTQIHVSFYIYNRWWAHKSQDNWQFLPIFCHCSSVLFRQHVDDDVSVHMEELPCSISICGGSSFTCLIRDVPLFPYIFMNFDLDFFFCLGKKCFCSTVGTFWPVVYMSKQVYTHFHKMVKWPQKAMEDLHRFHFTCWNWFCCRPPLML